MGKFKFELGDKIKCVDAGEYAGTLTLGKVYEVAEKAPASDFVRIRDDLGRISGFYVSRFELVPEPPKFRVGMKVWSCGHGWTEITRVFPGGMYPIETRTGATYTLEGKRFVEDAMPTLFLDEIKPEDWPNPPAPKPKASELKVGDHVECLTNFTNEKYLRRQVVFVAGEQVWVQDLYNQHSAHKAIDWRLPSPE
jgi:hypothetical protein